MLDQFALFISSAEITVLDVAMTPMLALVLIWLSVHDVRTLRLPDAGTLPLIALGLILATWRHAALPVDEIAGALAGFALFAAIGAFYFKARGVDGLGLGDAKLLAASGAWLGWQALPLVILLSSVAGIVLALGSGRTAGRTLPFGPMLSVAFLLLWLIAIIA